MGPHMRHQNWPLRLNTVLIEFQNKSFAWGEHDCCLFAANVVRELTGVDHAVDLRGAYTTAQEAAEVLKKHGGVRKIASDALGNEIPALTAQRGDVVLIDGPHGDTLAICIGDKCVAPGVDCLQPISLASAISAWRVN